MLFVRLAPTAALVIGLGFSGLAAAQGKTWNFGDQTNPGSCTGSYGTIGNTISCTQQPAGTVVDLTVKAYSAAGDATKTAGALDRGTNGNTYAAAAVNQHGTGSGIGVAHSGPESGTSPDHSMDNLGNIDMLLLSFTSAQVLKTVTLGWSHSDSDFQLLRWTGGAFVDPAGKTAAQLLSGGWSLVNTINGGNTGSTDTSYSVNGSNFSSSYWLISAFNSAFGGSGATTGVDGMKVLAVTAMPLPGSLALAGLGLVGLAASRRRGFAATAQA